MEKVTKGICLTGAKRVMTRVTLEKDIMTKEVTMKSIKENTTMIGIMTGSTHLTTNNIMALKIVIMKTATTNITHLMTNTDMVRKTVTTGRHRLTTRDVLSPD